MNEPHYEPIQGIRAVKVDGAENLFRQGEYYAVGGQLVMKCPNCTADNLCPKSVGFSTGNWIQKIFRIDVGLTMSAVRCWRCNHGFQVAKSEIYITKEPIHA